MPYEEEEHANFRRLGTYQWQRIEPGKLEFLQAAEDSAPAVQTAQNPAQDTCKCKSPPGEAGETANQLAVCLFVKPVAGQELPSPLCGQPSIHTTVSTKTSDTNCATTRTSDTHCVHGNGQC
jgi:hypothetical protein